jgi:multidrug efflux pump
MVSKLFIQRPIFAWVLAIVVMLGGALALVSLPVSRYPDVAPPQISVTAVYPGANAQTLEDSVVQVIEDRLHGLRGLLYYSSTSSASGQAQITLTFKPGVSIESAQLQVQNKLQQAVSRLPAPVQQQGLVVTPASSDTLLVLGVYDATDRLTNTDLADYLVNTLQDPLSRVEGVGDLEVYGSPHAMRIWLDPHALASVQLTPADVQAAVQSQNADVTAGAIGGLPAAAGQQISAPILAQDRLQTPEQFGQVILKTKADGSQVRLADVARIEVGAENYGIFARLNGHIAGGLAVHLAPGANALATATRVKALVASRAADLPPGVKVIYPRDSTDFIRLSIEEVVKTLLIAVVLVVAVMYLFLQSWRATLIPAVAVPVVLLGTFGVFAIFGLTINTMTLFGLVLAIGLLVDDAIVVVENVARLMAERGLSPRQATEESMRQITSALVGVALVLSAVFLPMAFFGGATGVIYRQFSVSIISAMWISALVALTLTPALTATVLRPEPALKPEVDGRGLLATFNRLFEAVRRAYGRTLSLGIARRTAMMAVFVAVVAGVVLLYQHLPKGFVPEEDQGAMFVSVALPPGASEARTIAVMDKVQAYFLGPERRNVKAMFAMSGVNSSGNGQNAGLAFLALEDFDKRLGAANRAQMIAQRATAALGKSVRDARIFPLVPAPVPNLGQAGGFDFQLIDAGGVGRAVLAEARDRFMTQASADPRLALMRVNSLSDTPQLRLVIDRDQAAALGIAPSSINALLSGAWGATYINDFVDHGRIRRVFMQGDAQYRGAPEDLSDWYVRGASGEMAPLSGLASASWSSGPQQLQRFNGAPSYNIQGQAAPGVSSGQALTELERLAKRLPKGVGYAWSGLSLQERQSSGQAPLLYALSVIVVFLSLAALYESWTIPLSVLMVIPLGVAGAVLATALRGLQNDIYFQVGLLTTIGLSAKNAILIVEFAEARAKAGEAPLSAALEAARLRFRPILMTSLAFIAGVSPLALAHGPGASSQNAIGTGVVGGMLSATLLTVYFVPVFYLVARNLAAGLRHRPSHPARPSRLASAAAASPWARARAPRDGRA